jgi:transposase
LAAAHARSKFFDLHVANKIRLAEKAVYSIGGLYDVKQHVRHMSDDE